MSDTVNYKGYSIEISQDHDPLNPRTEWDNISVMHCVHRSYNLGDDHTENDYAETMRDEMRFRFADQVDVDLEYSFDYLNQDAHDLNLAKIDKWIETNTVSAPLYLYDHSGISISTGAFSCPWDSGLVGYAVITKAKMLEEFGGKYFTKALRARAESVIKSEVETYDQYLTGNVYRFDIEGVDEGCGSFFGYEHDKSGLLDDARELIDCHLSDERERKQRAVKALIRNRAPLQNRAQILTTMNLEN